MRLRAKLKDVILLPEEGNAIETGEIRRLTEAVKGDDNAEVQIMFEFDHEGHVQITSFQVKGIAAKVPEEFIHSNE